MRTDGVHCQESTCTGPVVLKVVPVTGAAYRGNPIEHFFSPLPFSHLLFSIIIATSGHDYSLFTVHLVITQSRLGIKRVWLSIVLVVS